MLRRIQLILLAAAACLFAHGAEAKEVRLALLIGNADYPADIGRLTNTHADASKVDAALRETGFETMLELDLDEDGMNDALDTFGERIAAETQAGNEVVAFFYYSGHGAAAYGDRGARNFLIPAREEITEASQIYRKGVELEDILDSLQASAAKAVFVVSDACRNELKFSFSKGIGDKGMARVEQRSGMLVAFATAAGETAPDDGLFAEILSEEIRRPGQDAALAFYNALAEVSDRRPQSGRPFMAPGKLPRGLCFAGCHLPATQAPMDIDQSDWDRISIIDNFEAYSVYLDLHPEGKFAPIARSALNRLSARDAERSVGSESSIAELAFYKGNNALSQSEPEEALKHFVYSCELGFRTACGVAGSMFESKSGDYRDLDKALHYGTLACDEGDGLGCTLMGKMYGNGIGVEKDLARGRAYYEQACDAGQPYGCVDLGTMLIFGYGGNKDNNRARELFEYACTNGVPRGCTKFGQAMQQGVGGGVDLAGAIPFIKSGCDGRDATGCAAYGWALYFGQGIGKDESEGVTNWRLGCELGSDSACNWLDELGLAHED
ncbi:MAG: caspase family protein [Hyphomonas sp.]